jgi:thiol-disulfide isomerase/thioredoxin
VFAITTLIFLSGFLLADFLADLKYNKLNEMLNDLSFQTASTEIEHNLLLENPCSYKGFNKLTADLETLGEKLIFNEAKDSKTNSLKNNYFLYEIKHWLFVKKLIAECNANYTAILYFYATTDCDLCEAQGIVLSEVKKTHKNILIYSFDINSDYSLINILKEIYDVKTAPSVIINDKLYENFLTQEDLEKILFQAKLSNNTVA